VEGESTEKIFCPAESLQPATALPRTAQRPAGKDKVGYAAHSFNVPEVPGKMSGWISGEMIFCFVFDVKYMTDLVVILDGLSILHVF